jgi:hypothetical protein
MQGSPRIAEPAERRTHRRLAAVLVMAALAALAGGCENLVARGSGGSETGVSNAEFGIRF